jgi:ComF family protein
MMDRVRALSRRLVDLVYPPSCIACGAAIAGTEALCAACWRQMPFLSKPVCDRYGTPLPVEFGDVRKGGASLSPAAITDPPVFGRARAVARYDGVARDLVHRLKYGDRTELAPVMGQWMAREGAEILDGATLLLPVPLHFFRLWRRKFNQASLLAEAISKHTGIPVAHETLRRVRATRPQVGLTRAERAANLEKAFAIHEPGRFSITGRRVIIVDDVMTTASTGNAAARTLLKAGAASVDLLVFALVANSV